MTTMIRIPTPDQLHNRLAGVDRLLTATKWERAAIVYAYTEVQTNKGSGTRPGITPPKMNIRDFASKCYHGLSTNKSVSRYREAWVTAISEGWAVPVEPGDEVALPDQEFPAWPYGEGTTWEDTGQQGPLPRGRRSPTRPFADRVIDKLNSAAVALRQLSVLATDEEEPLSEDMRVQVVEQLTLVRDQADVALKALAGEPVLA